MWSLGLRSDRRTTIALLVASTILVSACGSVEDFNPFASNEATLPPPCPSVSILAAADRMVVFREGAGRDLTDIDTEAVVEDFLANCIYDVDDETGTGQIDIELSLGITVARGPANTTGYADIPYFVTLATREKTIVSKGNFELPISFEGNRYRLTVFDEPVLLTIPIEPPDDGYNYIIYIGLQVTPEQLKYNQTTLPLYY